METNEIKPIKPVSPNPTPVRETPKEEPKKDDSDFEKELEKEEEKK